MLVPTRPKIYHLVHHDRLSSIIADGYLWCDAEMENRPATGSAIGMQEIKERRRRNRLRSYPGLRVGDCVPFYFCPRSVMLYRIHMANRPGLSFWGGQGPIVHLEADFREAVGWARANGRRWAFTTSNAGSGYFEDFSEERHLGKINWDAVHATQWSGGGVDPSLRTDKQAEFLMEQSFPWELVSRVGVRSAHVRDIVEGELQASSHRPLVGIRSDWYY